MMLGLRSSALVLVALASVSAACGGSKTNAPPKVAAPSPTPTVAAEPKEALIAPSSTDPFPSTQKVASGWSVVQWTMNDGEVEYAMKSAGFKPERVTDTKTGRVVAIETPSTMPGWKATLSFDEANGNKLHSVIVRGDSVTIDAAKSERTRLNTQFGKPKQTKIHRSRQWGTKAVEIEGDQPAWRVTQSLMRDGKEKGAVAWPSLTLSWGMSPSAVRSAMKTSGFLPETITPPPVSAPPAKSTKSGKKAKTLIATAIKQPLPPGAPRGSKVVELTFKKGDEHVLVSCLATDRVDKTGVFKVGVGQDVTDRATAEERATLAAKGLGAALSEAETESSIWKDDATDVKLAITGFQGQRIVVETYRNPSAEPEAE